MARSGTNHRGGRPTKFSQEILDEICERLAEGETLIAITRDAHMPSRATVYKWEDEPDVFRQLQAARLKQANSEFEQIRDLADTARDLERARLQIDARKFRVTRMNRALYGDRSDHTVTVPEALRVESTLDLSKLTPEEQETLRALSRKALQK